MFVYDDKWEKRVPRVELYHELRHSYDADRGTVIDKTIRVSSSTFLKT